MCNMKLVTFRTPDRGRDKSGPYAGVVHDQGVITLGREGFERRSASSAPSPYATLLELLRDPEGLTKAQEVLGSAGKVYRVDVPLAPLPDQEGMVLPVQGETGKE